jgi:hypothetical protein
MFYLIVYGKSDQNATYIGPFDRREEAAELNRQLLGRGHVVHPTRRAAASLQNVLTVEEFRKRWVAGEV